MSRIAYRHMQFVCRNDIQIWIAIFPPILVPGDDDVQCIGRTRRILDREDHTCRRQEQGHNDENRDNGPGQFHLSAPVDLRGLGARGALAPESHHRVGE